MIKFRVKDQNNHIIGYETFIISMGWCHFLQSEMIVNEPEYDVHSGIIKDFDFGVDFLIREQFTGIVDNNKNELYANDEVINESGEIYKITWNTQQAAWWIFQIKYDVSKHFGWAEKLGNGTYSRNDLTVI